MPGQYAALPPEANAAMIEAGPGEGPVMAAGAAMHGLSAAMAGATGVVSSAIAMLEGAGWTGPSGATTAASFMPNTAWMAQTVVHASTIAAKHEAFGAGYRAAYAMIPKLATVEENQAEHLVLQGTNFLGINTGAIAANRGLYGTYWSTAGGAMNTWEAVGATESTPLPLEAPPPITSGAGDLLSMGLSMGIELGTGLASGAMQGATTGLSTLSGVGGAAATGLASATGTSPGTGPGTSAGSAPGAPPAGKPSGGDSQQLQSLLAQLPQAASAAPQAAGSLPNSVSSALSGPAQAAMSPFESLLSGTSGAGLGNGAMPMTPGGLSGMGMPPIGGMPGAGNGGNGGRSATQSAGLMRSAGVGGGSGRGLAMPSGWRTTASSMGLDALGSSAAGGGRAVAGGADLRSGAGAMGAPGMFAPGGTSSSRRRSDNFRSSTALSWEEDPFGAEEPADLPMVLAAAQAERGT